MSYRHPRKSKLTSITDATNSWGMKQRQQPHGFPGVAKKAMIGFGCLVMLLQLAEVRTCPDDVIRCRTQSARPSVDKARRKLHSAASRFSKRTGLSGWAGWACPCGADENPNVKSQRSLFHRSKKKKIRWESAHPQSCLQEATACICWRGGKKSIWKSASCAAQTARGSFFFFFPSISSHSCCWSWNRKRLSQYYWVRLSMCCVSIAWCTSAHEHVSYVHFVPYDARETNFLRAAVTESLCGEAVSQQPLNQQVAPRLEWFRNLCQLLWNGSTTSLARQRRKAKRASGHLTRSSITCERVSCDGLARVTWHCFEWTIRLLL